MAGRYDQQIRALHAEGHSGWEIARQLGLSRSYVYDCLTPDVIGLASQRQHEAMMKRGSKALLAAIQTARANR